MSILQLRDFSCAGRVNRVARILKALGRSVRPRFLVTELVAEGRDEMAEKGTDMIVEKL